MGTGRLLARAYASANGNAALPLLTTRYTEVALTERFRRLVAVGDWISMALRGISATVISRTMTAQN